MQFSRWATYSRTPARSGIASSPLYNPVTESVTGHAPVVQGGQVVFRTELFRKRRFPAEKNRPVPDRGIHDCMSRDASFRVGESGMAES